MVWGSVGRRTAVCTIMLSRHYSFGSWNPHVIWPRGVSALSWELGFAARSPSILETAWGLSVGFVRNRCQRALVTAGIQIP